MILLGARTLRPLLSRRIEPGEHDHGGHRHAHYSAGPHRHDHGAGEASSFGILHGLAGGPHLLAAAPVALMSARESLLYLAYFSAGTIAAMTLLAFLWGRWTAMRPGFASRRLRWNMGLLSMAVGAWWLVA